MKTIVIILIMLCAVSVALAQPINPTNPVPLDGGLSLLIAAGAAYGGKKILNAKKSIEQKS